MFTGIVQGVGEIIAIREPSADFRTHIVKLPDGMTEHLQIGASVANNGCCLTITQIDGDTVSFDLMKETLEKTNLGRLKTGDTVNLERAARFGDEIGGHVMSGHIMTTTRITRIERSEFNRTVWFALLTELKPYIFEQRLCRLGRLQPDHRRRYRNEFNVHLIPETLTRTLFGSRKRATSSISKSIRKPKPLSIP